MAGPAVNVAGAPEAVRAPRDAGPRPRGLSAALAGMGEPASTEAAAAAPQPPGPARLDDPAVVSQQLTAGTYTDTTASRRSVSPIDVEEAEVEIVILAPRHEPARVAIPATAPGAVAPPAESLVAGAVNPAADWIEEAEVEIVRLRPRGEAR